MLSESDWLDRFCGVRKADPYSSRVLAIAAHPDDEAIGMGARFSCLKNCYVVHVTDGAPNTELDARTQGFQTRLDYAEARHRESLEALGTAGIPPSRIRCLGIVDQESSYQLDAVATNIAAAIEELTPDVIVTHPYEGGHPDHDATSFAVHAALQLVDPERVRTALLEFTSYHLRAGHFETCAFLESYGLTRTIYLSTAQRLLKSRMLSCYVTQQAVLAAFPVSIERFRVAPYYDFSKAPHEGPLYYDYHEWGVTSTQWRALAAESMARLGVTGSFSCQRF